jgi:hypothetical protein
MEDLFQKQIDENRAGGSLDRARSMIHRTNAYVGEGNCFGAHFDDRCSRPSSLARRHGKTTLAAIAQMRPAARSSKLKPSLRE